MSPPGGLDLPRPSRRGLLTGGPALGASMALPRCAYIRPDLATDAPLPKSAKAEIDGDQVRGQLLDLDDLSAVQVTLETAAGESWTTGLDEVGFFAFQAEATGSIRFTIRRGKAVASSRWVEL